MVLQLYVLGAAFDLPSIDAECIAAIALLQSQHNDQLWTVTACHASPETLPLLIDGEVRMSGFSNIAHHIRSTKDDIKADDVAITALIQSRAPVLISAYLYLSYENYSTTTRPAFTPILPVYARFIIPSALRSAAKESTKQLGIDNLDVEALDDKHASSDQRKAAAESSFEASAKDRASLLLPKVKTVRGLLAQRPEGMAAFKLRNLADGLLEPLKELLNDKDFFGGSRPGQLDCLAYAYLGLMLKPAVPRPWLSKIVREHHPSLVAYLERIEEALELSTKTEIERTIPWTTPADTSFVGVLGDLYGTIQGQLLNPAAVTTHKAQNAPFWSQNLTSILLAAGSALVAGASWTLLPLLTAPHGDPIQVFGGQQKPDYSHLSHALSGLSFAFPDNATTQGLHPHVVSDDEPPARVGIEIES